MVDIWLFTFTNATLVVTIKYCRIIFTWYLPNEASICIWMWTLKIREGLRSISFHFEFISFFEFYFSQEKEKIKLIEWNEKDRNVDLGTTTTMVLIFFNFDRCTWWLSTRWMSQFHFKISKKRVIKNFLESFFCVLETSKNILSKYGGFTYFFPSEYADFGTFGQKKQNPLNLLHWILFYHYITKLLPKENISHNPSFYLVS
jgi:hypothetical protein